MRIFDWLGRTLLLVMAGLATLSIIASVASVSNIHGTSPSRPGSETAAERSDVTERLPVERDAGAPPVAPGAETAEMTAPSAADAQDGEIARWLESLTYAVLALAGFMAAALLVLLRITALLARIAER